MCYPQRFQPFLFLKLTLYATVRDLVALRTFQKFWRITDELTEKETNPSGC